MLCAYMLILADKSLPSTGICPSIPHGSLMGDSSVI